MVRATELHGYKHIKKKQDGGESAWTQTPPYGTKKTQKTDQTTSAWRDQIL